jgi:hypothetical protein
VLEHKLSSKYFLKNVLMPHVELAIDLARLVNSRSEDDPSHRFQIASIIIFLAGVDKMFSLAFELLYLAGKVDWNWMKKPKTPAGYIECQKGLTAKIMKFQELGIDITHLQTIVNLRNEYIHSCSIYIGYTVGLDEIKGEIQLKPSGPSIGYPLPPTTFLPPDRMQQYAESLVDEISSFIDSTEWEKEWFKLMHNVKDLPQNPEPEYTQILDVNEPEKESVILEGLNDKFTGDGAVLLMK